MERAIGKRNLDVCFVDFANGFEKVKYVYFVNAVKKGNNVADLRVSGTAVLGTEEYSESRRRKW